MDERHGLAKLEAEGVRIRTIEWEVRYPVHVEPIGQIRRRGGAFQAKLFPTGDAAVEAIWQRFLDESAVRHEHAAVTHGGSDRHTRGRARS